jgi:hypothetical protein
MTLHMRYAIDSITVEWLEMEQERKTYTVTRVTPVPSWKSGTSTRMDLGSRVIMPRLWLGIAALPTTATPVPKDYAKAMSWLDKAAD